jgi:hypothetical protein
MQARIPPREWIERRSVERCVVAHSHIGIVGAALCAYGKPASSAFDQRAVLVALYLRVLTKPHRSRAARSCASQMQ